MKTMNESDNMEEKIIKAAKSLFIEKGFAETSMSDIAAKVGINRPGLHYYFRTKDKMFEAVFGDIVLSIVPKVFDILVRQNQSIASRIEEVVNAYYSLFLANPRLPMFIIREMNRDSAFLIKTAIGLNVPEKLNVVVNSLQEEMDRGKLKQVPLRFLFYTLYGLLMMPFLTQDIASSIFLEENETFKDMLDKWKPYIISQLNALLAAEK